jgi:hypothetical protein
MPHKPLPRQCERRFLRSSEWAVFLLYISYLVQTTYYRLNQATRGNKLFVALLTSRSSRASSPRLPNASLAVFSSTACLAFRIHPAASSAGSRVHALTRGWRARWGHVNHSISQLVDALTGVRYKSCLPSKHSSRQRSPQRALTHPSWGRASHPLPSGARAAAASSHDQRPHIALSNRCDGPWSGVVGRGGFAPWWCCLSSQGSFGEEEGYSQQIITIYGHLSSNYPHTRLVFIPLVKKETRDPLARRVGWWSEGGTWSWGCC